MTNQPTTQYGEGIEITGSIPSEQAIAGKRDWSLLLPAQAGESPGGTSMDREPEVITDDRFIEFLTLPAYRYLN